MRLLAFIIVLIACAYQPAKAVTTEEQIELCTSFGNFAEVAMMRRQEGAKLSHFIKIIHSEPTLNDLIKEALIDVATMAYEVEIAPTQATRNKAVKQYKYEWLHKCYSYETR